MQIMLPIRLTPLEQTPLGPAKAINVLDEIDFLMMLNNSKETVRYQEGLRGFDVYVNSIDFRTDQWNRMDHHLQGIVMVELHTVSHP